ncbi:hypothetical protein FACS1894130_10630 [Spirochaetia bacterium]|nr:hypothetical protein FACS1894130_10630 [Spirochaetia bacterium]
MYEHWTADFTKPSLARFDIKSENSYDANLLNAAAYHALSLSLKKPNCLVWVENPCRYSDMVLDAHIRLDPHGGYAAAGLMFRSIDEGTYYSVLISSKGYFRLDVLRNGVPLALIGWTEVPLSGEPVMDDGQMRVSLTIIAYGSHIALAINSRWAAEIHDTTISSGRLCFALASYEAREPIIPYAAEAFLESFTVESRIGEVEAAWEKWTDQVGIDPKSRFHLAETFAAMGQHVPALIQLKKVWDAPGYVGQEGRRTQRELLLAARLAFQLDLFGEAEEYADACIALGAESPEGREALIEKAKILYTTGRFAELKAHGEWAVTLAPGPAVRDDSALRTLLGHAYWETGEYEKAAAAYDTAFERDRENALAAKNAANTYELLGRKAEALDRYLQGGRAFLAAENYADLGNIIPRLLSLGAQSREAHALAGKWAFGIEDWSMAKAEFTRADELCPAQPATGTGAKLPAEDPAVVFLQGLLLLREGKRAEALSRLERAAELAPDYPLFRLKLAENRFLLNGDPNDPKLKVDLDVALSLNPDNGWAANLAAQIALSRGDSDPRSAEEAAAHLERAVRLLGEVPAIRVNRAALLCQQGFLDQALATLASTAEEDSEGLMANCAGNLLFRVGRFEEADKYYCKALAIVPANTEYLCNRASCLIELGRYGESDELLAKGHTLSPSPAILELIAWVAAKKGEYPRAETASRAALDMDPNHIPSLLSLGWLCASRSRWDEAETILRRLDALSLTGDALLRCNELHTRIDDALTQAIPCASCGRVWRVPRSPPQAKPIRLFAMPPDELPAGTCSGCGKTWCIGCAKATVDGEGRFRCPDCGTALKLTDEGLKKIVGDWADASIPQE